MATSHAFAIPREGLGSRRYGPEALAELEALLARTLDRGDAIALGPAIPIAVATSKRVRPALVLAAAEAVGIALDRALDLAAAVELVHTFSLIHDDIEDGAAMRRGQPAVHTVVGIPLAINTGDALHLLAWTALLALDATPVRILELARQFGITLERMVAGQARDLLWTREHRTDVTLAQYIEMVRGKTGALLGFAAAAPAIVAGEPCASHLATFGEELGVAFQILDDVASLQASTAVLGKPVGAGANGVGSAPALLAADGRDGTDAAIELAREYWRRAWTALEAAQLPHDSGLRALAETIIEQLLARHTAA